MLSTRFNYERGFITESKRGGGGHITIMRADDHNSVWLSAIFDRLGQDIDYRTACYILDELANRGALDDAQVEVLKTATSPNALSNPFKLENHLRAQILKRILLKDIKNFEE